MCLSLTTRPYPFLTHLFLSNCNNIQPSYESWQNAKVQLSSRKYISSQIVSVFHFNCLFYLCLTAVPKPQWVVLQYQKYHSWQECVWLKPVVHCNFIQQYSIIKSTCRPFSPGADPNSVGEGVMAMVNGSEYKCVISYLIANYIGHRASTN